MGLDDQCLLKAAGSRSGIAVVIAAALRADDHCISSQLTARHVMQKLSMLTVLALTKVSPVICVAVGTWWRITYFADRHNILE